MDIKNLRYFVTVAQTMNITKAAEQLVITRQALSKAISEFEKECGSNVFLRNNGKLQLTSFGRNLLEKSIPIVDMFSDFEQSVNPLTRMKKSRIKIAIGLGTLNSLSPHVFTGFRQDYPDIDLLINEVCDDEVRRDVDLQAADVGIQNSTPERLENYDIYLIQEGKIYFQINKRNPLSMKKRIEPQDLNGQPFVTLGERNDAHSVLMEKCKEVEACPNLVLETIDSNVANSMVYNDEAISLYIQSKYMVTHKAVRIIPLNLGNTPWGTYLISRKGTNPSISIRYLIDYLVNFTD